MRAAIEDGDIAADEAIECLVLAITRALGSMRRSLLAHPFSLLPKIGLGEEQIPASLLNDVATAAARAGALVEINEKWRCPAPRTVAAVASADVHLVVGSDSHYCENTGIYNAVIQTVRAATAA
jgi:putative hydrolase